MLVHEALEHELKLAGLLRSGDLVNTLVDGGYHPQDVLRTLNDFLASNTVGVREQTQTPGSFRLDYFLFWNGK